MWLPSFFPDMLIARVRWLIDRPANAPAFPAITDAKQPEPRDTIRLMPDQKPTLEYGGPEPSQESRNVTRIIKGAVSLVLAGLGLLIFLGAILILRSGWGDTSLPLIIVTAAILGSLLLWLAWINLNRKGNGRA